MIFGNWEVTDFGIIGLGKLRRLKTKKEDFFVKRENILYDCMINIAEMGIVSELNVYEYNAAFVYALSFFQIGFSEELSLSASFSKQIQIVSEKTDDIEFEGGLLDVEN
jgi:hypothetical protein